MPTSQIYTHALLVTAAEPRGESREPRAAIVRRTRRNACTCYCSHENTRFRCRHRHGAPGGGTQTNNSRQMVHFQCSRNEMKVINGEFVRRRAHAPAAMTHCGSLSPPFASGRAFVKVKEAGSRDPHKAGLLGVPAGHRIPDQRLRLQCRKPSSCFRLLNTLNRQHEAARDSRSVYDSPVVESSFAKWMKFSSSINNGAQSPSWTNLTKQTTKPRDFE